MRTDLSRMVTVGLVLSMIALTAACSSSSTSSDGSGGGNGGGNGGGGGGGGGSDGGAATNGDGASGSNGGGPLTCASYTWCGSGEVRQWNGQTLPTARGGTIPDGLYREAYILAEKGTGTAFGDYGSAYLFRSGSVRELGDLGSVGTFATMNGKLAITETSNCDDQSGMATSPSTATASLDYLVDANGQLFLFFQSSGSSGMQTVAHVYLPQQSLCGNLPTAVPATPGDSYVCKVQNCGCTEAANGPADADTCKFVHGG